MSNLIGLVFDNANLAADAVMQRHLLQVASPKVPLPLRDDVRAVAIKSWENRTHSEYIGVMIMRHFHGLLVDVNAPLDLQELAVTMMLQEQQHANLCMQAAKALGSDGVIGFARSELQIQRTEQPLTNQLLQMIVATFAIGEVVAYELLSHTVKVLPDSDFRQRLKHILKDEVLHARSGCYLLNLIREQPPAWLQYPGDQWVVDFVHQRLTDMQDRDVVEAAEARLFQSDPEASAQLLSVGVPASDSFKKVYLHALEIDVCQNFKRIGFDI